MPRESFAALVARHTAILEELYIETLEQLPAGARLDRLRTWNISMHEIEKGVRARMEASDYERERRAGQEIAATVKVVAPRRG